MNPVIKILTIIAFAAAPTLCMADEKEQPQPVTTKQERNFIREGNKLYREKRFADAEVQYRKALEQVPHSEIAQFNLAASLIRQSGSADPNSGNNPMSTATNLLQQIASESTDAYLAGKSFYNLGNIAFNSQDYGKSIELYKNALRKNPDDDKARENLRLAQLKQREQEQNKDNNQNQNQDKQQNQDQNDKDKNQNQDNKDQNQQNQDQDKKDQDQQQNQQNQDQNKDKQQQQQQGGISDANAEKILKAMENEEAATRKRVDAEKKKAETARRKKITNPW
ncbi:MAG: tetratricopeptide repeat protein [Paramuribaculum sp.]|nr:tetratricopeptide repeat protein [Paramuribaculum sp.]